MHDFLDMMQVWKPYLWLSWHDVTQMGESPVKVKIIFVCGGVDLQQLYHVIYIYIHMCIIH